MPAVGQAKVPAAVRTAIGKFRPLSALRAAARDERGVSAVTVAISVAVLAPMALGIFDVFSVNEQRGKLQDALDAATLYAARSPVFTTPEIDAVGDKALNANLQMIHGASLQASNFTLSGNKVVADASVQLPAFAPMAFTQQPVQVHSEVTRSGNNLEVALVLDNTGSMAGAPISQLQTAANQLIDLVVADNQSPYYTKMAIVPYSNAVNAGAYVNTVRGAATAAQTPLQGACLDSPGCTKMKFHSSANGTQTYNVTNCVSERTGPEAFTDASYATAGVGWVYAPGDNPCIGAAVQPLTSSKTTLHGVINGLTTGGSTAGHIGMAWGWYMVSPNWGDLWPSGSQPAAYGSDHLIKAVILMTDGAFNTAYCKGAISNPSSAQDGSAGGSNEHTMCASPNGDSFTQAQALCNAMKAAPRNIVIYTVGFLHGGADPQAAAILASCATDAQHYYLPTTGASLQTAFQSIAADLERLRISH
jgi:Flp pilus assembly protein TadG